MSPESQPIDLLALSQAIMTAHHESSARQEKLLAELPKLLVSQQQHVDLERRVAALEAAIEKISEKLADLPERILERIEGKQHFRWQQGLYFVISVLGWAIIIALTYLKP